MSRSPRRRLHAVVAAVIASMFGASAFAWYARAPRGAPTPAPVLAQVAPAPDDEARDTVEPAQRTVRRVEVTADPEPPAAAPAPEPTAASPTPDPRPTAPARSAPALSPPSHDAPAQAVAPDRSLALYATAHHLHFQQRDMTAALDAWDRYLAAAPNGSLAPEARFNRVVALVKLARWADASRALDTLDPSFRPADVAKLREVIRQHSS